MVIVAQLIRGLFTCVCRCKLRHREGDRCEICERVAVELPHQLTELNDDFRLLSVLTKENVFDQLNRPESQMQFFVKLQKCAGYYLAMKMLEHELLTSWYQSYLAVDDSVSTHHDELFG